MRTAAQLAQTSALAALAVDPDANPTERLTTLLLQRRARALLDQIDFLFLKDVEK